MVQPVKRIDRQRASASEGRVLLDWPKAIWFFGLLFAGLAMAPFTTSRDSLLVFALLTYSSLLLGHSVGMHRMTTYRGFQAMPWLEKSLIYVGVIVGMGGPFGIIRTHDLRDWAQRQDHCHDYFSHRRGCLCDVTWQLAYRFLFDRPPTKRATPTALSFDFWKGLGGCSSWSWPFRSSCSAVGLGWSGACCYGFPSASPRTGPSPIAATARDRAALALSRPMSRRRTFPAWGPPHLRRVLA